MLYVRKSLKKHKISMLSRNVDTLFNKASYLGKGVSPPSNLKGVPSISPQVIKGLSVTPG